jgi:predicted lipoprotein with Yx(FWY)xxD motif
MHVQADKPQYVSVQNNATGAYNEILLSTRITGDVNGDGKVNVSDVTALINMILGIVSTDKSAADVNGDGVVNVSDVTALINIILG